ncbi:MAG: hypothetical protein KGL19_01685 [Bacteroidota bacterium]|nr:hypothetical protein [Bacteroidota bacterium]
MRKTFITILIIFISAKSFAQGCVAIRSNGGYCSMQHIDSSKWQLSVSNRYFKSYKHFIGTTEQKQRQTLGNEVINHQFTTDIALTHKINSRWSFMIDLPIEANTRSSLYEHSNVGRYLTHSFGAGDIRFAVYDWLWNPEKMPKGNLQAGLGIKLPTGNYNYQDYFHLTDSTTRLGAVDQSIQLGDGGTGITFELNGFYNLSHKVNLYGNFYYLSNPREQNGVSTARGGIPSVSAVKNGSEVMSVPDQYMIRAGASFIFNSVTASIGVRDECLPVHDLIGGSGGFRRPGYIISAEPGVTYQLKKMNLFAYIPVAIVRSRTQSVPDKITTQLTGIYTQGDAAFADFAINIGLSVRF